MVGLVISGETVLSKLISPKFRGPGEGVESLDLNKLLSSYSDILNAQSKKFLLIYGFPNGDNKLGLVNIPSSFNVIVEFSSVS